jgi:hypothetical protein
VPNAEDGIRKLVARCQALGPTLVVRTAGKPAKVALTACMQKLLTILNAIARDGTPWQPDRTLARTWFPRQLLTTLHLLGSWLRLFTLLTRRRGVRLPQAFVEENAPELVRDARGLRVEAHPQVIPMPPWPSSRSIR